MRRRASRMKAWRVQVLLDYYGMSSAAGQHRVLPADVEAAAKHDWPLPVRKQGAGAVDLAVRGSACQRARHPPSCRGCGAPPPRPACQPINRERVWSPPRLSPRPSSPTAHYPCPPLLPAHMQFLSSTYVRRDAGLWKVEGDAGKGRWKREAGMGKVEGDAGKVRWKREAGMGKVEVDAGKEGGSVKQECGRWRGMRKVTWKHEVGMGKVEGDAEGENGSVNRE